MRKLLHFAAFAGMVAVLACSGTEPTPVPTPVPTATPFPTQVPTATPVPTARPQPTATPVPTPTSRPYATPEPSGEGPEETGVPGGIVPLSMGNPDELLSQLEAGELRCLMQGADLSRLVELQEDPSLATPEEAEKAIDCLGDESALRAFLTEILGLAGPLSEDTSACLRAGFGTFDVRSVMVARQVAEDNAAYLTGSASAFMLTLSCLNEEEWRTYVPPMIMNPDEQGRLQCVVATLGGPEELAAALQSSGGGVSDRFLNTANECGLQVTFLPGG